MKLYGRKKSLQLGVASLFVAIAFSILSGSAITADFTTVSIEGIKSLGIFSLLSYLFLVFSLIFFFYSLFKKD